MNLTAYKLGLCQLLLQITVCLTVLCELNIEKPNMPYIMEVWLLHHILVKKEEEI